MALFPLFLLVLSSVDYKIIAYLCTVIRFICMRKTLLNKLDVLFRSPYPELQKRWKTVVFPALLVFFILYFLQPFGISRMEGPKLLILSGYMLVSAAMLSVVVYVFPAIFPAWHCEERWTLGKELLSTLLLCVLVTLGNWIYTAWAFGIPMNVHLLCICLLWMVAIGPFPFVLFMLWNRNLQLRHNLNEAVEMNAFLAAKLRDGLQEPTSSRPVEEISATVVLGGETKESLILVPGNLLYAESEGNYVCLHYLPAGTGTPAEKLLRLTLKQVEESFAAYPDIIRCHRAFVVNLRKVAKVTGNAQGYRLHLEGCEAGVPVSRAYAKVVKRYFEAK